MFRSIETIAGHLTPSVILDNIYDACPKCNSYLKGIIKGKELLVKSLEVS